jgi:ribonuclease HI
MLKIYTDGSCLKNPNGPGGWAVCIIEDDNYEYYFAGGHPETTNNRMELKAVIEAISCLKLFQECTIFTDSQLVIKCATGEWKRNSNLDLWSEYENTIKNKNVNFQWVKGHSGDKYNEIVDKLAYNEAIKHKK